LILSETIVAYEALTEVPGTIVLTPVIVDSITIYDDDDSDDMDTLGVPILNESTIEVKLIITLEIPQLEREVVAIDVVEKTVPAPEQR